MDDPLLIYLEDHLAGAAAAVSLLEAMRDDHATEPLGRFAAEIVVEVEADRAALRAIAERIGKGPGTLKEATAWLAEKVSRLKLGRLAGGELGTFEALEALALGILGKKALWQALSEIAPEDPRLQGTDFPALLARAEDQHRRVEAKRREAARAALRSRVNEPAQS